MTLVPVVLALLVCPADPFPQGRGTSPLESGAIVELVLPGRPGTRTETFRLDPPEAHRGGDPLGVARILYAADPGGDFRLEAETHFFEIRTRVLHVELLNADELRLVWREIGERSGRTVLARWSQGGQVLRTADTMGAVVRRRELDVSRGALMPLYLLEQIRSRSIQAGPFDVFRPITGRLETVTVATHGELPFLAAGWEGSRGWTRTVSLRRADGTVAGRFAFQDRELLAFQRQAGGPLASAIPEAEYRRLLAEGWGNASASAGQGGPPEEAPR